MHLVGLILRSGSSGNFQQLTATNFLSNEGSQTWYLLIYCSRNSNVDI